MLAVLAHRSYRHLFAAQVVALLGTGLMTVALALLAFEMAGERAGTVLGTALAIKMIAYVAIAPLAGGIAARLPRRSLLVALDVVRAATALALPFVDQVWQIYVLIAVLQSASAAFTPTFQATIPDILTDERDYTRALSLSRLAYDLENLLSPVLAAALISLIGFHWLFAGTVFGFLASALLVLSVALPQPVRIEGSVGNAARFMRGLRIFAATPRLRGLMALNLAVAAAGAMVIVNSVVLVKGRLAMGDTELAIAMAAFGAGSMVAALALPRILDRLTDRGVMIPAAASMAVVLMAFAGVSAAYESSLWPSLLIAWILVGLFYSAAQVPTGRLLRRSSHAEDRPALYAAQFALSHACWLVTYPLAGWLGRAAGLPSALLVLGLVCALGAIVAARLWPAGEPDILVHNHPDLAPDHPHLRDAGGAGWHAHAYVIDDLHNRWPMPTR